LFYFIGLYIFFSFSIIQMTEFRFNEVNYEIQLYKKLI